MTKLTSFLFVINVFISTVIYSQTLINGRAQITGDNPPTTGAGVEIGYNNSAGGQIVAYDRANSTYKFLYLSGSELGFITSGTEKLRILSNGNVGIGITPAYKLHVKGALMAEGDGAANYADFNLKNGNVRWHISGPRYGDGNRLGIFWNDGSSYHDYFTIATNGNVGIGTSSPGEKLAVNGTIHAKEVRIDLTGWPDYVFEKDYNLSSLAEVERQIREKGHLKDIPSAKEVEKNGINLGEMNAKLLLKIEELTLYMIEFRKELDKMSNANQKLQQEIIELKKN
jgi:hypothetical protein